MDTVLGVSFNDFVIIAADKTDNFGILRITEDNSKIYKLTTHIAMGIMGEPGDTDQFARFVQCNFELEKFRDDGWELSLDRAFHWITWELAQSIRSNHPYSVFPMVGGYDSKQKRGKVYWIDYLGTGAEVTYGAHGYGEALAVGFLDRHHRPDLPRDQAIETVKGALNAMQKRIVVRNSTFQMVLADQNGIHALPDHVIKY